jgi:hypothetical protein
MKAIVMNKYGGPEVLIYGDFPLLVLLNANQTLASHLRCGGAIPYL